MGDGGPHEPPIVVPLANGTRKLPLKYAPTANGRRRVEPILATTIAFIDIACILRLNALSLSYYLNESTIKEWRNVLK